MEHLKPYRKRVKARMVKNKANPTWSILKQRFQRLLELAKDTHGGSVFRHQRKALEELSRLKTDADPDVITEVALAMYLLQEDQPRIFKSDTAFDFQLVRRIRTLADTNAGEYWDNKEQRTKRVYRDLPPRVVTTMAEYLKGIYGAAGLTVARLEQEELDKELDEKMQLQDALGGLK